MTVDTRPDAQTDPPMTQRVGQLVPAAVGTIGILIVLAVRGTQNPPSPLAVFALVSVVIAVIIALAATIPPGLQAAARTSGWDIAVRTGYLALLAAALYVVQEIVVLRLGDSGIAQSDQLLALELLALILVALFISRAGIPGLRRPRLPIGDAQGSALANAVAVLYGLLAILAVLLLALLAFAIAPGTAGLAAIGTGLAVTGGALAFGALLGLLFGIPRSAQSSDPAATGAAAAGPRYRPNTNLEEISDWLTKIIVGVSLTQLGEIRTQLFAVVKAVAGGFGGSTAAQAFAAGLLATALIAGFLASYLITRLYLRRALDEADSEVVKRIVEQAASAATATQADQSRLDAEANRLATQQLDVSSPEVPAADLAAAFKPASDAMRTVLLGIAQQQRSKYWAGTSDGDLQKMERTIPIFRALLDADPDNHLIHGQLGFALKDKSEPDYSGAVNELTSAITLRDKGNGVGWRFYEFNRALARIRGKQGTPKDILDDLCAAAENDFIRGIIEQDGDTIAWLKDQSIEPTKLRDWCASGGKVPAAPAEASSTAGTSAAADRTAKLADKSEAMAAKAAEAATLASDAADAAAGKAGKGGKPAGG